MTRYAIAVWNNRIAPVFDVSNHVTVFDVIGGNSTQSQDVVLHDSLPVTRAQQLARLGVDVLICGAISRSLHVVIVGLGIEVVPFIAGDRDDVENAILSGQLVGNPGFAMPGCCRGSSWRWARPGMALEGDRTMIGGRNQPGGMGGGQGGGQGQGRGQGRRAGRAGRGPGDECVCPQCGYREPHRQGEPCLQRQCPKCSIPLIRP